MKNYKLFMFGIFALALILVSSCNDPREKTTYFTTDEVNISQYLENNSEIFSEYIEILYKTGYYSSLSSYGTYTCLVPNNQAVTKYISKRWGVNSVSKLTTPEQIEALKLIVEFHTLDAKRLTNTFSEGRLSNLTFSGDFLTISFLEGGGLKNVTINYQAKIISPDLEMDNGVIHVIDNVIEPTINPVPVDLEKTGKYTIFVDALKKTGYFDIFSTIYSEENVRYYITIFAESDSIFKLSKINSFNDLANLISPGNSDYLATSNKLNQVISYHAARQLMYTSDFPKSGLVSMELANSVMKFEKEGTILKINETETGGENETWVSIIVSKSNIPSRNGVYHSLDQVLDKPYTPPQKYMIWDPWDDQPEVKAGSVKLTTNYPASTFQNLRWFPDIGQRAIVKAEPCLSGIVWDWKSLVWLEMDTPVLPKGKYEMTICSNGGNTARAIMQISWDGEPVGKVYDLTYNRNTYCHGWPDSLEMESNGWRFGLPWIKYKDQPQSDSKVYMRFVVTKNLLCPVQKSHVLRFDFIKTGTCPMDYIEWIPVID